MFTRKLKQSGVLYRRRDALKRKFDQEWNCAVNQAGSVNDFEPIEVDADNINKDESGASYVPCSTPIETEEPEYLEDDEAEQNTYEESIPNSSAEDSDENEETYYLDSEESGTNTSELSKSLRTWLIKTKISRHSANELLKILRRDASCSLPQDSRTLLKAPVRVGEQIRAVPGGGQLWYHGIESCLVHYYRDITPNVSMFEFNLSIDGIPLYNRSSEQMWPILMQLHGMPHVPVMVVAIYSGSSKPADAEAFLRPLVVELNQLHDNGLCIDNKQFSISLRAIIADSPARAFIKQVCYFNGVYGCLKCKCLGTSINKPRKVIFEDCYAEKRTDEEFRNEPYSVKGHRRGPTPLTDVKGFDIIEQIPIGDKLHLIDLGIMHKLLLGWVQGALAPFRKWSPCERQEISEELINLKLPSEFLRKFRSLDALHFWKGSEFAYFLSYGGILVLQDRIGKVAYEHFKLLYCAVAILSSNVFKSFWELAGTFLTKFVEKYSVVYHRNHLVSNVHLLLHLYDEVCRFGPLGTFTTYPFEDKLQHIKHGYVRTGYRSLHQAIGKITLLRDVEIADASKIPTFPQLRVKKSEVITYVRDRFLLRNNFKDSWFLTRKNNIFKYCKAEMESGKVFIYGYPVKKRKEAFSTPCSSSLILNFICLESDISTTLYKTPIENIKCKMVALQMIRSNPASLYLTPVLHTLV